MSFRLSEHIAEQAVQKEPLLNFHKPKASS